MDVTEDIYLPTCVSAETLELEGTGCGQGDLAVTLLKPVHVFPLQELKDMLLGSVILPPSHIPKWNPMFPYVVLLYVFLCFRLVSASHLDLSLLYYTSHYLTSFTFVHLSISHPSPVPPVFLSVRLEYPWTPLGLTFHPIIPVPARIVFED